MFSVICVYNNKQILDDWLIKSLQNQTAKFELITIDNTQGQFKSAAEALNYGGKKATGKYLMFVHQDIDLSSGTWLEEVEKSIESLSNVGVVGVVGRYVDRNQVVTNIKHDIPPKLAGRLPVTDPVKVQTVDECLAIIPKSVFNKIQFDEIVCDDWHLYITDYCLAVKKMGLEVYVIPAFLYHMSAGFSFSGKYYLTLKKVLGKHKRNYRLICTPYGRWSPYYPLIIQRPIYAMRIGAGYICRKLGLKK